MKFGKFRILNTSDDNMIGDQEVNMLINYDHIISIKPIRINRPDQLIDGYWIRTSNGKKYRATIIPEELERSLDESFKGTVKTISLEESSLQ